MSSTGSTSEAMSNKLRERVEMFHIPIRSEYLSAMRARKARSRCLHALAWVAVITAACASAVFLRG